MGAMKDTIKLLKDSNLRDKVKIIVGGAPITQSFADATKNARKYVLLVTNTSDVLIFNLEDKIRDDLLNLSLTNTP